jgi:hypothetical protein
MNDYWGGVGVVLIIPLDEPQVASESRGSPQTSTNGFVEEWLAPQSIIDLVAYAIIRNAPALWRIVLSRHEEAGPVTDLEVAALRLLGPHFRRAV